MPDGYPREIDVARLRDLRGAKNVAATCILDIREPWEVEICAFEDSINLPMGFVPQHVARPRHRRRSDAGARGGLPHHRRARAADSKSRGGLCHAP